MSRPTKIQVFLGLGVLAAAGACGPPSITGDPLKGTTTGEAFAGVTCSAVRPQTEPDLMAWDPGSRSNLNRLRREGVVAVRYVAKGCNVELELLSNCIGASGKYTFSPYSANERKVAHNANELFAQLPVGAGRFAADLKGNRALRTDYMMAGQYALPAGSTFEASDLHGPDCSRATHVISAVYVGAFAMGAGESRVLEGSASFLGAGAGAKTSADVEVLRDEGDAESCKVSQRESKESERCAVPLRIGLVALEGRSASASPSPSPAPTAALAPQASPSNASVVHAPPKQAATPTAASLAPSTSGFYCYRSDVKFFEGIRCFSALASCQQASASNIGGAGSACTASEAAFCFSSTGISGVPDWSCSSDEADCQGKRTANERASVGYGTAISKSCAKYTSKPAGRRE